MLDNGQIGSYLFYKDALKSIEQFAGTRIQFESITVDWLRKYEKNLLNLGRSFTTIGLYCTKKYYLCYKFDKKISMQGIENEIKRMNYDGHLL